MFPQHRKILLIAAAIIIVLVGYFVWRSTQPSQQPATSSIDDQTFPVPALYSGYAWQSSEFSYKQALYMSPSPANFVGTLAGTMYNASNTDPGARTWEGIVANAPGDRPIPFYGGDQKFLSYYDSALRATGYQTTPITLGKYTLGAIAADGPSGTIRGYIKYEGGRARVIIVASSNTDDQVFISAPFDFTGLVPAQ